MFLEISTAIAVTTGIVGLVITSIIITINLQKRKKAATLEMNFLLGIYAYVMSIVTLLIFAYGTATLITSTLSYVTGYQFSYEVYNFTEAEYLDTEDAKMARDEWAEQYDIYEYDGNEYYVDKDQRRLDIVNGVTFAISGLVLNLLHRWILKSIKRNEDDIENFEMLDKFYRFLVLVIFGLLMIISIPTAIYQTINYYTLANMDLTDYSRPIPGSTIAVMLVSTPMWVTFLKPLLKK